MNFDEVRSRVAINLRSRDTESVEMVIDLLRNEGAVDLSQGNDEYIGCLVGAVTATFDYCLAALEYDEHKTQAFPSATIALARHAAQTNVPLSSVVWCCNEGGRFLRELLSEETRKLPTEIHTQLSHMAESALGRLAAAMITAYESEVKLVARTLNRKRDRTVRRILAGELPDAQDMAALGYAIQTRSHLAIVATGLSQKDGLTCMKSISTNKILVIGARDDEMWAWLPSPETINAGLELPSRPEKNADVAVGIGGEHAGLEGFRRSHQEAQEALRLALRTQTAVARYAENPLLTAVLRSDVALRWLQDLIAPLSATHRRMLRAYIDARCNASSAAAAMSVDRHTITRYIVDAEERIKRPLQTSMAELDVALSLADYGRTGGHQAPRRD